MHWAISPFISFLQKGRGAPFPPQESDSWSTSDLPSRTGDITIFHSHLIALSKEPTLKMLTNIWKALSVKVSTLHLIKAEGKNSMHLEGFSQQRTRIQIFPKTKPVLSTFPGDLLEEIYRIIQRLCFPFCIPPFKTSPQEREHVSSFPKHNLNIPKHLDKIYLFKKKTMMTWWSDSKGRFYFKYLCSKSSPVLYSVSQGNSCPCKKSVENFQLAIKSNSSETISTIRANVKYLYWVHSFPQCRTQSQEG